jgi:hypothetical protein
MYGLVNKAIQGLIIDNYGKSIWEEVKLKSKLEIDVFISNEPYPDETTYILAAAASEVLGVPVKQVLFLFGEYWILKTGQETYGSLMHTNGTDFREFLINLPNFHSRVMLIYPNITPPEFRVTDIESNSLHLHYYSTRQGLQDFMLGLISGLGKMFSTPIDVLTVNSRLDGHDHEIFKITW